MKSISRELRKAITAAPDSPEPKLVCADWLEEHGDERAKLFRAVAEGDVLKALMLSGVKQEPHHHKTIMGAGLASTELRHFAATCVAHAKASVTREPIPLSLVDRSIELAHSEPADEMATEALIDVLSENGRYLRECYGSPSPNILQATLYLAHAILAKHRKAIAKYAAKAAHEAVHSVTNGRRYDEAGRRAAYQVACDWQLLRLCEYKAFLGSKDPQI